MLTVFFVEDSDVMGHRLREMLGRIPGVVVVGEARRLEDLVQAVEAVRPDVVLLDIRLPDGLGFDAVHPLHQLVPAPAVFIVTAHGDPQYRARATSLRADGFFDKATELELLCTRLAGMCEARQESPAT